MPTIVPLNLASEETMPLQLKVGNDYQFGNWGFLHESDDLEKCYSHPLCRRPSFSALSAKSLELCTENLGSETGSDIITDDSSIFACTPPASPLSSNSSGFSAAAAALEFGGSTRSSYHQRETSSCRRDFPPPLTTMSGSSSLQVRRRAEGGRLIIEAVETPFRNSYLQAERSDGRLRLCYLIASDAAETACGDVAGELGEDENGDECGEEIAEEEQIEDPGTGFESEIEEFGEEINLEIGIEKFRRPSRCKDDSHGQDRFCCTWKPPLCVT